VAKSRAQRKAEQARKRQQQLESRARESQSKAQHDTEVPISGDVEEFEAALESSAARADQIDESTDASPSAPSSPEEAAAAETSGASAASREQRKAAKREERLKAKEAERKARASAERRAPKEQKAERQRGRVMTFFSSVIAELRKVQWPDRDTLIQASAVTLLFVAVAAAYLGILDAIFGWLVDRLIT
jgi:preprotein translocase subunit SecE